MRQHADNSANQQENLLAYNQALLCRYLQLLATTGGKEEDD